MKNLILFMVILLVRLNVSAQNKPYPVVGDTFPDHTFYDLDNYPAKSAKISDFRGKWLLLDMWGYSCSACLASFDKMNHLNETFKDNVKIILVGATKGRVPEPVARVEKITKDRYYFLKSKNSFTLTAAFDSVLYLKADVGALPHIFVIDPKGILRAKVVSVDSLQLASLIAGGHPQFTVSYSNSEQSPSDGYNKNLPFLTSATEANGGVDTSFIYRSLLSNSTEKTRFGIYRLLHHPLPELVNGWVKNGRFEVFNMDLLNLFQIAYLGTNDKEELSNLKIYSKLVYVGKDTLGFERLKNKSFTYSTSMPSSRASVTRIMEYMQQDLIRYTGYTAKLKDHQVPVYALVVTDAQKARKFVHQKAPIQGDYTQNITIKNAAIDQFLSSLSSRLHLDRPLVNETGIEQQVNISFKADLGNKTDVEKQLAENGFKIVETIKSMQALVLEDK